jgi:hypothetical protein
MQTGPPAFLHRVRRAALAAPLLAWLVATPAGATCGSANCFLITGTQEGVVPEGRLVVDLSYRYIPQDRKIEGSHSTDEVLTPRIDFENETIEPDHHREISTLNSLVQLDLSYGVGPRLAVVGSLPLINNRPHEHYDDVGTPDETYSGSDGTSGFGDVRVGVRGALLVKRNDLLVGGFVVKAPTGPYRLLDSEGLINEPTLMPGTGSWDWVASLHYSHMWSSSGLEAFASGAWRLNGTNPLEYRIGDEGVVNVGVSGRSGGKVTWSVQVNTRKAQRDEYLGERVQSTGSTYVNLTPGLRVTSGDSDLSFYGFVQVPVYQYANEAQLAPRTGVLLGVSKMF